MTMLRKSTLFAAVMALCASAAFAALPIDAIRKYQQRANNEVEITVTGVKRQADQHADFWRIELAAKVTKVNRSKDMMTVGDQIIVRWSMPKPNAEIAGDWASPPNPGSKVRAYLNKDGQHFKPAAFSGTFERVQAGR